MHKRVYREALIAFVALLFFMLLTRVVSLGDQLLLWVTDTGWTLLCALAAWKSWQVSALVPSQNRLTWRFLAYAHLSWLAGILIWDYLELIRQQVTPFPALSDIGFMLFAPLYMVALVRQRNEFNDVPYTLIQVSKLGVFASSIVVVHIIIFSPLIATSAESSLYVAATLIYPVLYISAFLYAILGFWQCNIRQQRPVALLIAASIAVHAFTVSIYAYSLLGKTYAAGNYIDVLWLLAFVLAYLAGVQQQSVIDEPEEPIEINTGFQRLVDITLVPISMILLLALGSLMQESFHINNIPAVMFFIGLLVLFYAMKELATDRHEEKLHHELQLSEQRFRDISNNIPGIVYRFNMSSAGDMSFSYVSPRVEEYLGIQPEALMQDAQLIFSLIEPLERDRLQQSIVESYKTMQPWQWETVITSNSGAEKWFKAVSSPRRVADGDVIWDGVILDVSERKYAEQALIAAYDQLEFHVQERTRELAQARDDAEQASHAKSQFLSHMSHELRTPLNAIIGFSQVLKMEQLSEDQQDSIGEIETAGQHLLGLVNDVLDLEKIESGSMNVDLQAVDVNRLIEETVTLVKPMAAMSSINIRILHCEQPGVSVLADEIRIKEILLNLLSNAIKYNRQNGDVTLCCDVQDDRVKISVIDSGSGIQKKDMENLFVPFDRLGFEASNIEGTGIGLTISKKLIELMHGEIGAQSVYGEGSTFWITLPKANGASVSEVTEPVTNMQPVFDTVRKVLYIEDNPANLRLVQNIFKQRDDIELMPASDADQGLVLATKYLPDLILMDINLPGIDGYTAFQILQNHELTREIPVFALTAEAMPNDIEKGIAHGFRQYITKPIDVKQLMAAIDAELGAKPANGEVS